MKTSKKIIAGCVAIAFSLCCHAEKTLTINGSQAERSDVKEITFAGDNLKLTYENGETFAMDMETVEINFTETTSIKESFANTFSYNTLVEEQLELSGLEAGSLVQVFRMDGRLLHSSIAEGERMTIPVSNYTSGSYLLKAGNQIVKFMKK